LAQPPERGERGGPGGRGPGAGPQDPLSSPTFSGLSFRSIGPASNSGRVVSISVDPRDRATYYVAAASGGVWKTTNNGTTWTPVFQNEGSYSIGVVHVDPKHPDTVWVGTGESNSQRSVSYGDGVYRSDDGGRSWRNLGLKTSLQIGKIVIDPRDSNVVYVAALGSLWGAGGDRGLFKTTDGGRTWNNVLKISENTGVSDVVMDPSNPDVLLAASWQRRRHVWTLINGGPESGLHKSTDGGKTWRRIRSGLPFEELGRIGLSFSPVKPGLVYARVEAQGGNGVYRSTDSGESWERRGAFQSLPMYYGQIIADPMDADTIYLGDTIAQVSEDGGRTLRPVGDRNKHVDTHTFWIDPKNNKYLLTGCDGGVYESYDGGQLWHFKSNLPITQFYNVALDSGSPFYNVYGGTQDNNTLGGPSGTRNGGIANDDWFEVAGGDGFVVRVDPKDPNIIYGESQYGGLVRFDKRTGERVSLRPVEGKGEEALRFNWETPFIISPHQNTRLFFGTNRLFRSDDRGNSWKAISPDLTAQIDRNKLPVFGKIQSPDAIAKHESTSIYGNLTGVSESPKKAGLLYTGSDDGVIHVSENAGTDWKKRSEFPGVPANTYVQRVYASRHDTDTVYALFDNHKNNDFKPYLLKSTDKGATWTSITGDLPENGPALAIAEDPVNSNLLFVGTEFGLYFTPDGGKKWIRLRGGLPTIAVRDIAIHERENDLVIATFGRGFYILDDYSALRQITKEALDKEAILFPAKSAMAFIESNAIGAGRQPGFKGESYYIAQSRPYGATFTYYLKDGLRSKRQQRQEAEREANRKNEPINYPTPQELTAERDEEAPQILLTITDNENRVVRRLTGPAARGIQRVTWNLREPGNVITAPGGPVGGGRFGGGGGGGGGFFGGQQDGFLVPPGTYKVQLAKRVGGVTTNLGEPQSFRVVEDSLNPMTPQQRKQLTEWQKKANQLSRAVTAGSEAANTLQPQIAAMKRAVLEAGNDPKLVDQAASLETRLRTLQRQLRGDETARARQEPVPTSIQERAQNAVSATRNNTSYVTGTAQTNLQIASEEFADWLAKFKSLQDDVKKFETALDAAGVPHTAGRLPDWKAK
jgi:photosystem II stability/assembly factor-like uncharacterized protein